jgi:Tol biopolymer transport system component/DNA-binding winged helix-turn-helix (wHTH) protein
MMSNKEEREYRFGDYQLAAAERVLRRNGEIVPLPLKSLEVLLVLVEQNGRVVSKEELMEQVWPDSHVEEANLARHIYTLRKTLGESSKEAGGENQYIRTVSGRGYRFVMDVQSESITAGEGDERPIVEKDEAPAQPRRPVVQLVYHTLIALVALGTMALIVVFVIGWRRVIEWPPEPEIIRLSNSGDLRYGVISPDRKYIAKVVKNKDQQSLWVQLIANGSETLIVPPTSQTLGCLGFSPDSGFVHYTTRKEDQAETLYQIPVTGGNPRRVTEKINSPISFAPDGRRFAFVREAHGRSSLMIASLDGAEEKELIARETPAEYLDYPAWSPDDSRIVCTFNTETGVARSGLIEVSLKDRAERRLPTPRWKLIRGLVWRKDGSGLVVTADESFNRRHAWYLPFPADSRRPPRRLTTGVQVWRGASITDDAGTDDAGELVCIERIRIAHVWVGDAAAPESEAKITQGGGHYEGLAWTPDGRLLYSSDINGSWHIFLMNADGEDKQQLTYGTDDNIMPSMSPDGRYIFFTSDRNGAAHIWRIDKDGSNPKQITFGTDDFAPQCTPDGKWVLFTSPNSKGASALHRMPVEGGEPEALGIENVAEVVISPDGKSLACLMREGLSSAGSLVPTKLTIISLADGNIRHLGKIGYRAPDSGGTRLRWRHDGRGIVYIDSPDGNDNLWMQPLAGGEPQRLTSYSGDGIFGFDFSRNGRLAVLRGPVIHRIVRIKNPFMAPGMR